MNNKKIEKAIQFFLEEDFGSGDITTYSVFEENQKCDAVIIAQEDCVIAGVDLAKKVFQTQNQLITFSKSTHDGHHAAKNEILFIAKGPVQDILIAERVALNLLQRLCGIATLTAQFVEKVKPLPVRIVDTRKTTPGLRYFEKLAVRAGGGHNHRFTLSDGVLIKDNHISACDSISQAVKKVREKIPHTIKIEVETESLDQVQECLDAKVEIIMLDNMEPALMKEAVALINGRALVEASGGVNLNNVREIAETGVDIISIGKLTHSAPACDISLELIKVE